MIKICAVMMVVLVGTFQAEAEDFLGFKNSQQCQCECECPDPSATSCLCDCDCPRPGSSCGPGFTQVCPSPDGSCPDNYMPLCPQDLTAAGRADTPMVQNREAYTASASFKCSKDTTCNFELDFADDCTSITSAKATCNQKKTKCNGKTISFAAGFRDMKCLVTGTYKNTGKKQTFKGLSIAVNPDYTTTTTSTTTTSTTAAPGEDFNCQCVPDFMLYMGQLAMQGAASRQEFMGSCVCVAGMMDMAG